VLTARGTRFFGRRSGQVQNERYIEACCTDFLNQEERNARDAAGLEGIDKGCVVYVNALRCRRIPCVVLMYSLYGDSLAESPLVVG